MAPKGEVLKSHGVLRAPARAERASTAARFLLPVPCFTCTPGDGGHSSNCDLSAVWLVALLHRESPSLAACPPCRDPSRATVPDECMTGWPGARWLGVRADRGAGVTQSHLGCSPALWPHPCPSFVNEETGVQRSSPFLKALWLAHAMLCFPSQMPQGLWNASASPFWTAPQS